MFKIIKGAIYKQPNSIVAFIFRDFELKIIVPKNKTGFYEPYLSAELNKNQLMALKKFIESVENDARCDLCWDIKIFENLPCNEFTCKYCGRLVNLNKE